MARPRQPPPESQPQPQVPPQAVPPGPVADALGVTAGAAAAAPLVAGVASEAALAAATAKIIAGLTGFFRGRRRDDSIWLRQTLRFDYPQRTAAQIDDLVASEMRRQVEFERRMRDRLERDMPKALRETDPEKRAMAVQKLLDREKRHLAMRQRAMAERASARAEQMDVKLASPDGAYWKLDPTVKQHTLDCLLMGEKFWPWEVLDQIHPLLHTGCQCHLYTRREAEERGWMLPGQPVDVSDAVKRARQIMAHAGHVQEAALPGEIESFIEERLEEAARGPRSPQPCDYCEEAASKSLLWADGRAYTSVCPGHEKVARAEIAEAHGEVAREFLLISEEKLAESAAIKGAMIALYPTAEAAQALAEKGGEPPEQLHITLKFLGNDASEIQGRKQIEAALSEWAKTAKPLAGKVVGLGEFKPNPNWHPDEKPVYAEPDVPGIQAFRRSLVRALPDSVLEDTFPDFKPHITLRYVAADAKLPKEPPPEVPLVFDRVYLVWSEEKVAFLLGTGERIEEADYTERLHPRGREGKWIRKPIHSMLSKLTPQLKPANAPEHRAPLQERGTEQGRYVWMRGRYVFVPRHREFSRKLDHVHFSSPAGGTNIYRNGHLVQVEGAPAPPHHHDLNPPAQADIRNIPGTAEYHPAQHPSDLKLDTGVPLPDAEAATAALYAIGIQEENRATINERVGRALRSPMTKARKPVEVGDYMAAVDDMLEMHGFTSGGMEQVGQVGTLRYDHHPSGAHVTVKWNVGGSFKVTGVDWTPGRDNWEAPPAALDHPPVTWEQFADEVRGVAYRLAHEHGLEPVVGEVRVAAPTDEQSAGVGYEGFAGSHNSYTGEIILAPMVGEVLKLAKATEHGTTQGDHPMWHTPDNETLGNAWGGYKVGVHEALHGAGNVIDPRLYRGAGKAVEESLVEELAHVETVKLAREHGVTNMLEWLRANPQDQRALGTYRPYRRRFEVLLNLAKIAPEQREDYMRDLRFNYDTSGRIEKLVADVAWGQDWPSDRATQAFPDGVEFFVKDFLGGGGDEAMREGEFVPILRPDLTDFPSADGVVWNGKKITVGSVIEMESGERVNGRWRKKTVQAEVLKIGQANAHGMKFKMDVRNYDDWRVQHNVHDVSITNVVGHANRDKQKEMLDLPGVDLHGPEAEIDGKRASIGSLIRSKHGAMDKPGRTLKLVGWAQEGDQFYAMGADPARLNDPNAPSMVLSIPLHEVEVVEEGPPFERVNVGDTIRYDGRLDGGYSEAIVTGVQELAPTIAGRQSPYVIEAITTENSLKPGTLVSLTPERMNGVTLVPSAERPTRLPVRARTPEPIAVAADPGEEGRTGLYAHGTTAAFETLLPQHGAVFLTSLDEPRVRQYGKAHAEYYAAQGGRQVEGGRVLLVQLDQSRVKLFDPRNDPRAREIAMEVLGDHYEADRAGRDPNWLAYESVPDILERAVPEGYNTFRFHEWSVGYNSTVVTDPSLLTLVEDRPAGEVGTLIPALRAEGKLPPFPWERGLKADPGEESEEARGFRLQDEIMKAIGAHELESGPEHHPEQYMTHPRSGFTVRNPDVPRTMVVNEVGKPPRVQDTTYNRFGNEEPVPGTVRPPKYLFRAVSEEEYQGALKNGYLQSDGRMNLIATEGTVAAFRDPTYYLPGKLASSPMGEHLGRVLRIQYHDEDGWLLDTDGYVKTPERVPFDRVDAAPQFSVLKTTRPSSYDGTPMETTIQQPTGVGLPSGVKADPGDADAGRHAPSEFLVLPKSGKLRGPAKQALAAVDGVLRIPPMHGPIPVRATAGKNTRGGFLRRAPEDTPKAQAWEGPTVRVSGFGKGKGVVPAKRVDEVAPGDELLVSGGYRYPVRAVESVTKEIGFGRPPMTTIKVTLDRGDNWTPETRYRHVEMKPDSLVGFNWKPEGDALPSPDMEPVEIRVSTSDDDSTFTLGSTLVHELGHYIDNQAFESYFQHRGFGSDHAAWRKIDPEKRTATIEKAREKGLPQEHVFTRFESSESPLSTWHEAVMGTPEVEALRSASMSEIATHKYLLSPKELWARSFAQWVALRSNDPSLMAWLRDVQNQPETQEKVEQGFGGPRTMTRKTPPSLLLRQWQDESFAPVAAAMDSLFEELGWRHGGSGRDRNADSDAGRFAGARPGGGNDAGLDLAAAARDEASDAVAVSVPDHVRLLVEGTVALLREHPAVVDEGGVLTMPVEQAERLAETLLRSEHRDAHRLGGRIARWAASTTSSAEATPPAGVDGGVGSSSPDPAAPLLEALGVPPSDRVQVLSNLLALSPEQRVEFVEGWLSERDERTLVTILG